ncbi:MAG: helix-turn-helix domain-containing protein [Ktedonobacteraceae bacterium]
MIHQQSEREAQRVQANREELVERIGRALREDLDAASAAYRVGYHDASHFNREYKSLFGVPPLRDVQRLREAAIESAGR